MPIKDITLLTLSVLLFVSCKSRLKDEPQPEDVETCLLAVFKHGQNAGFRTEKYYYNNQSRLDSMRFEPSYKVNIAYDAQGRVQDSNFLILAPTEMTYDSKDRLKTSITKRAGIISSYSFYKYSSDDHLRSSVYLHAGPNHLENITIQISRYL